MGGSDRNDRMLVGVVSTLLGAMAWGASGTGLQYLFAHSDIDSLLLTSLRQLGAGALFLAIMLLRRRDQLREIAADGDSVKRLLIFGVAGLFLNSTLYATAISYTNAGTATVLQSLAVPMVLAISCVRERRAPRALEVAALICAALATFFIATGGNPSNLKLPPTGLFFGVATAAAAVFYTSYPKPLFERWGSFATTGIGMAIAGVSGIIFWKLTRGVTHAFPVLDLNCWIVLILVSLLGTFGAYGLFLHGISIVGPVKGNMLGTMEPVSATVLTALTLGTAFSLADWAGLILMVATIILVTLQSSETVERKERAS